MDGEWNVTLQGQTGGPKQAKGYWTSIVVREGDTWKDRMQIAIVAQAIGRDVVADNHPEQ